MHRAIPWSKLPNIPRSYHGLLAELLRDDGIMLHKPLSFLSGSSLTSWFDCESVLQISIRVLSLP
jgi:hypothetical protein